MHKPNNLSSPIDLSACSWEDFEKQLVVDREESVSPGRDASFPLLSCPVGMVSPQNGSPRFSGRGDRTCGPEVS